MSAYARSIPNNNWQLATPHSHVPYEGQREASDRRYTATVAATMSHTNYVAFEPFARSARSRKAGKSDGPNFVFGDAVV